MTRIKKNRWLKLCLWTLGMLFLLGICGVIWGEKWLIRYVQSSEFRQKIEEKTGLRMRAKVGIAPARLEDSAFFCDRFNAHGSREAAFSRVSAESIRGEIIMPSFFRILFGERKVRIPSVEVQQLTIELLSNEKLDLVLPQPSPERSAKVDQLTVRDVQVKWKDGSLAGASLRASSSDDGWKIEGSGGKITHLNLPPVMLNEAQILYKDGSVYIQQARLNQNDGRIDLNGEFTAQKTKDLHMAVTKINITPLLPDDWRGKLHGNLFGEIRYEENADDTSRLSGTVRLEDGVIEALPALNKIADFLKTDRFRRLDLNQISAEFTQDAQQTHVQNFVLESRQLIAVRGNYTIRNGSIDGQFDIGITPASLQWIPGSQDKVFHTQRDGYAWTTMRVTGPLNAIKEDLTPRLVAAAKQAAVEKVENVADQAVDTAVDAAKRGAGGVFDLLFGK
jgi:hypothetical protein